MTYTWQDLEDLAPEWYRLFGEEMPKGFEVTPEQVPIIRECIRTKSQKPLDDYARSIPSDIDF